MNAGGRFEAEALEEGKTGRRPRPFRSVLCGSVNGISGETRVQSQIDGNPGIRINFAHAMSASRNQRDRT
jgi:hypothetical protein